MNLGKFFGKIRREEFKRVLYENGVVEHFDRRVKSLHNGCSVCVMWGC